MSAPVSAKALAELRAALARREGGEGALRIFHGPGEGTGALADVALDRFGRHVWITRWGSGGVERDARRDPATEAALKAFIAENFESAAELVRPEKGLPEEPVVYFGAPPVEPFAVREGRARFWIKLQGARHPGLFLDHLPVRQWLEKNSNGLRVLNTFAYTGSLSVASGLGAAAHVTTLDLSKPVVRWARENWTLNGLPDDRARFIDGDVFEWLPRLSKKKDELFDCVILDPPSFSRGKKGTFSTSKDLFRLHRLALATLKPEGGLLITSINSANVSRRQYESEVLRAIEDAGFGLAETIHEVSLPETFPTRAPEDAYLKGWILRLSPANIRAG